jgi:hypothetical protein
MVKTGKSGDSEPPLKYNRVALASLKKGRHGKHHDLVRGILSELQGVPSGSALAVPLATVDGIGLANLRSAVHRGAASEGLEIETLADKKNFYVFKARNGTG